jgi:hypothetical protein
VPLAADTAGGPPPASAGPGRPCAPGPPGAHHPAQQRALCCWHWSRSSGPMTVQRAFPRPAGGCPGAGRAGPELLSWMMVFKCIRQLYVGNDSFRTQLGPRCTRPAVLNQMRVWQSPQLVSLMLRAYARDATRALPVVCLSPCWPQGRRSDRLSTAAIKTTLWQLRFCRIQAHLVTHDIRKKPPASCWKEHRAALVKLCYCGVYSGTPMHRGRYLLKLCTSVMHVTMHQLICVVQRHTCAIQICTASCVPTMTCQPRSILL